MLSKVEPVLLLLFIGILTFTIVLFAAEKFFPMDGQIFQAVAGILAGFTGAFFGRIKPKEDQHTTEQK